jgi:hypothetical protein
MAEETHRIQEPRADLRLLKQENLPLERPLPFRSRTAAILDSAEGQEIGISFREEVPRIPSNHIRQFWTLSLSCQVYPSGRCLRARKLGRTRAESA